MPLATSRARRLVLFLRVRVFLASGELLLHLFAVIGFGFVLGTFYEFRMCNHGFI
jgi:hypothetical protein